MQPSARAEGTYSSNGHAVPSTAAPADIGDANGLGQSHDPSGSGLPGPESPRQRPPGPSTHLALIVLGIAAVLMITGTVASGLTGGGKPAPISTSVPTAKGSPLQAVGARTELSAITSGSLPPSDIAAAVAIPRGATAVAGSAVDSGVAYYDQSLGFRVAASQQDVIEFFRAELPALRWHLLSQGPPSNGPGYEILGQHPGSDGYEWELGVTVTDETFPASSNSSGTGSAAGNAASSGTTPFTLRLFEVTDEQ